MTELYSQSKDTLRVNEFEYKFDDPYVDANLEHITGMALAVANVANQYYAEQGLDVSARKRTSNIDFTNNPATRAFIEAFPDMGTWMSMVPTAAALHPLYTPNEGRFANGEPYDEMTAAWFRNVADARGIRSRAAAMKDILRKHAQSVDEPQQWLSLASGAAQPVFAVLNELREEGNVPLPTVTLADQDINALNLAQGYADSHNLSDRIITRQMNVLSREKPELGMFDAVDAVGIFEYLKRPDREYVYNQVVPVPIMLAGADTFMRNAYELVKPGGILVIGNMLDTHPQLDFTMGVIQWPHIQPRGVRGMTDIMNAAGIDGEVDVYKPTDGVYAVYGIKKPN